MLGPAVGANGNIGPREVSREPMSIVTNLAFSAAWGWIDWAKLRYRKASKLSPPRYIGLTLLAQVLTRE